MTWRVARRQAARTAEAERDATERWLSRTASIPLAEARQLVGAASVEQRQAWREGARLAEMRRREAADAS